MIEFILIMAFISGGAWVIVGLLSIGRRIRQELKWKRFKKRMNKGL